MDTLISAYRNQTLSFSLNQPSLFLFPPTHSISTRSWLPPFKRHFIQRSTTTNLPIRRAIKASHEQKHALLGQWQRGSEPTVSSCWKSSEKREKEREKVFTWAIVARAYLCYCSLILKRACFIGGGHILLVKPYFFRILPLSLSLLYIREERKWKIISGSIANIAQLSCWVAESNFCVLFLKLSSCRVKRRQ